MDKKWTGNPLDNGIIQVILKKKKKSASSSSRDEWNVISVLYPYKQIICV